MIYMWFTGINYYKLAVEKDRDSIFTTICDKNVSSVVHYLTNSSIDTQYDVMWEFVE
jgi:hypothetical protein